MNNQNKFIEFRNKYPDFIYEKYEIVFTDESMNIQYYFNIPNLRKFTPKLKIPLEYIKKEYNEEYLNYLVFQIGLIELISYVKCTCSPNIIIEAGYINSSQIKFLNKLLQISLNYIIILFKHKHISQK